MKTFNSMGYHFKIPPGANPVDHYMHLMQKKVENPDEYTQTFLNFYEIEAQKHVEDKIVYLNNLGASSTFQTKLYAGQKKQWSTLLKRAWTLSRRDPTVSYMRLIQVLFSSFIVLSVWWQITDNKTSATGSYNRSGVLFFLTSFNFIPAMFAVLLNYPTERAVLLKEYSGRFYGIVPYYVTKLLAELPFAFFGPVLFISLCYYGINMNNDFVRFLEAILVCCLLSLAGQTAGVFLGCIFSDFRQASLVAPMLFYPMMLFSGFYANTENLPIPIIWIENLSIFRYGLEW